MASHASRSLRRSAGWVLGLVLLSQAPLLVADIPEEWEKRLGGPRITGRTPVALAVQDDSETGGAWCGRYGRHVWVLCGMSGMWDYKGGVGLKDFKYRAYVGENRDASNGLRAWVHWPYLPEKIPAGLSHEERERLRGPLGELAPSGMDLWSWPDVRRVLLNPVNGGRRQTSWDDHAEGYSPWFSREGPHIYVNAEFPDGQYLLSLYFVNKDAHWGGVNRFRDHLIQIKHTHPSFGEKTGWEQRFNEAPTLAETRVHDFYSGVYKRFFVQGPSRLTLRIHKGDSINTSLSGIFVDEWLTDAELRIEGLTTIGDSARDTMKLLALHRKLIQLKRKSPGGFLRLSGELAGWVGQCIARRPNESAASHFDRLKVLGPLFGTLLEFETRDQLWRQYAAGLVQWVEEATLAQLAERKEAFWQRCRRAEGNLGMTRGQIAELHRCYFETILRMLDAPMAVEEIRRFAVPRATTRPHLARVALLELEGYYQHKHGGPALESFTGDELFAWAQCHRQSGQHTIAARHFESFLERFPDHSLANAALGRLRFEREAASREIRLRNPQFKVAPRATRPE